VTWSVGRPPFAARWVGGGALMAIDLAGAHTAHRGPAFGLPLDRHALADVRVTGGALAATWVSSAGHMCELCQPPPDEHGSIRIDLASGRATATANADAPDALRVASFGPWRTRDGWSTLSFTSDTTVPASAALTLQHLPDGGELRSINVLDQANPLGPSGVATMTPRYVVLRLCDDQTRCALRLLDAETGAPVGAVHLQNADGYQGVFTVVGDRVLQAMPHDGTLDLVAFDGSKTWSHPLGPEELGKDF
jgi:hypothetical protein